MHEMENHIKAQLIFLKNNMGWNEIESIHAYGKTISGSGLYNWTGSS